MNNATRLDLIFSALADPTRRAIVVRLAAGEATASELAEPFGLRQPTISKHLRVLEQAGVIQQRRDAQRRPRSLVVGGPLCAIEAWLAPFRAQWEGRFGALDLHLKSKATERKMAIKKGKQT